MNGQSRRALRRSHRDRIRARTRRIVLTWSGCSRPESREAYLAKVPYLAENRQACSCPVCGNPRRWFGEPTRQERRAER